MFSCVVYQFELFSPFLERIDRTEFTLSARMVITSAVVLAQAEMRMFSWAVSGRAETQELPATLMVSSSQQESQVMGGEGLVARPEGREDIEDSEDLVAAAKAALRSGMVGNTIGWARFTTIRASSTASFASIQYNFNNQYGQSQYPPSSTTNFEFYSNFAYSWFFANTPHFKDYPQTQHSVPFAQHNCGLEQDSRVGNNPVVNRQAYRGLCDQRNEKAADRQQFTFIVPTVTTVGDDDTPILLKAISGTLVGAMSQESVTVMGLPSTTLAALQQSLALLSAFLQASPLAWVRTAVLSAMSQVSPLISMPLTAASPSQTLPRLVPSAAKLGIFTRMLWVAICPYVITTLSMEEVLGQIQS